MPYHLPHPHVLESGGTAAGHPQDASEGLPRQSDTGANVWAWNPVYNEWQRLHSVQWGDTLWNLSATYYGQPSLDGVHAIHHVEQNIAIQGPSADTGLIPGDVILIPGLPQLFQAPAPTPQLPPPDVIPVPTPIASLPGLPAPGDLITPPDIPFPGTGATVPEPFEMPPPGVIPQPVGLAAPPNGAALTDQERKRRNMMIGGAVLVGLLVVGGVAYSRSRRRSNPRRRRRAA